MNSMGIIWMLCSKSKCLKKLRSSQSMNELSYLLLVVFIFKPILKSKVCSSCAGRDASQEGMKI